VQLRQATVRIQHHPGCRPRRAEIQAQGARAQAGAASPAAIDAGGLDGQGLTDGACAWAVLSELERELLRVAAAYAEGIINLRILSAEGSEVLYEAPGRAGRVRLRLQLRLWLLLLLLRLRL
jgi:hypothetical protein